MTTLFPQDTDQTDIPIRITAKEAKYMISATKCLRRTAHMKCNAMWDYNIHSERQAMYRWIKRVMKGSEHIGSMGLYELIDLHALLDERLKETTGGTLHILTIEEWIEHEKKGTIIELINQDESRIRFFPEYQR